MAPTNTNFKPTLERPNDSSLDQTQLGSSEMESTASSIPDPIQSLFPAASANQLLSLIAQGNDASDLNALINNAA